MSPGDYLKRRRQAAGLSVADVAARLSSLPRVAEHLRAEQLELIEADVQPANFSTVVALKHIFHFDMPILTCLAEIQLGADRTAPRICRFCACSEFDACAIGGKVGCHWIAFDLCSGCAGAPVDQQAAAA